MNAALELLMQLVGIVGSIMDIVGSVTLVQLTLSPIFSRVCRRIERSGTQITQDTPFVVAAHRFTAIMPNWIWQTVTWTVFIAGYVSKSMSTWTNTTIWLAHDTAIWKFTSPSQGLLLDACWYTFTVYQTWQMSHRDYQDFLSLGGGGTPQAWIGFKRVTMLEWFGKIDTLKPPNKDDGNGYLADLEVRPGQRPKVVGIAPQRQLDQRAPKHVLDYLLTYLDHLSAENSSRIRTATSFLEKQTNALLANSDCVTQPMFHTLGCEIVHPHKVDGSLHCMLHPEDIEMVISAGWGERHSIARADPWWMFWFFATESRPPIPEHLCFLYAPRSEYEVCVVAEIVEAGVKFVTGVGNGENNRGASPLKGLEDMD